MVVDADSAGRLAGLTFGPTNLGRLALTTVVLSACMLVFHGRRDRLYWVGLGVGTVALASSGTRTSLSVAALCLMVLGWRVLGPVRSALLGLLVLVVAGTVFLSLPDPIAVVTRSRGADELTSFNGRQEVWQTSIDAIAASPIVGQGVNSGPYLFAQASARGELQWEVNHAHQLVLDLVMTQGFVGAVLFAVALVGYFATGRSRPGLATLVVVAILLNGATEAMLNRPTSTFLVLAAAFAERAVAGVRHGGGLRAGWTPPATGAAATPRSTGSSIPATLQRAGLRGVR